MQVILKPDPGNSQELYLGSLAALGKPQFLVYPNNRLEGPPGRRLSLIDR